RQGGLEAGWVRGVKFALIERPARFGELDPPQAFSSVTQIIRPLNAIDRDRVPSFPEPVDSSARCHYKKLTDPPKLSDACCQNCVSWTATSAALPRSETERFALQLLVVFGQTKPIFLNLSNGLQMAFTY